jgi:hypothetical protein
MPSAHALIGAAPATAAIAFASARATNPALIG